MGESGSKDSIDDWVGEEDETFIYLFAASSKAFDHRSRQLDWKWRFRARKWTSNGIARPIWTHYFFFFVDNPLRVVEAESGEDFQKHQ